MFFRSTNDKANKVYYLGEYNSGDTIDVASKYSGYTKLKKENFLLEPSGTSTSSGGYSYGIYTERAPLGSTVNIYAGTSSYTMSKNYDASTGRLVVGCKATVNSNSSTYQIVGGADRYYTGSGSFTANGKVKVYIVEGSIEQI